MATTAAKENILKKIRQALSNPVPLPFPQSQGNQPIFKTHNEDDAIVFAESFSKLQGKFVFCSDEHEMSVQLNVLIKSKGWTNIYCRESKLIPFIQKNDMEPYGDLATCDVSITGCEYLVARTGTIVMSSAQQSGRTTSVYAPIHICIAYSSQMVYDLKEALQFIKSKYKNNLPSLITFASGPSRTADIEKTLVTGVHGPKEVYCFLIEA
jgi:L-lactate dehydrogenase complex protein LldG